jgi:hypothetical protein
MHLAEPTWDTVLYVRQRAVNEIGDPVEITRLVMARPELVWVAWADVPVAVFGVEEDAPGVWHAYCFHTADFRKVFALVTRFARETLIPLLFNDLGATRIEASSPNPDIQKWMRLLGGTPEEDRFVLDKTKAQV